MTRYFTTDHEWLDINDGIATVGITDHAQQQLGDIVYVEQPEIGATFSKGDDAAVVESVKAASDVYAPVSGEIVAINESIVDAPNLVNEDAEQGAWFFKIKLADASEVEQLLTAEQYQAEIG